MKRTNLECEFFDKVFLPLRLDIYRYIFSRMKEHYATEEISQVAMMKAWEHLDQLRQPEKAKSWLFQITNNTMIEYILRRKKVLRNIELPGDNILTNVADKRSDIYKILERAHDVKTIMTLLDELGTDDRAIVTRHYIDGVSLKVIADEKGMNYNTVRSISRRAIRKLKVLWDKTETMGI